ncbi:hypothetical protein NQ318_011367 [Aromia moschata]|uniref:DUF4817 domain-containing protein n=1 Tax=Aromia moschata TaxID=1265417 RepID=A0AAV8YSC9_9CUCU|nr:hypothetical protein NQ318_011367 [Aromia moschata]
MIGYGDRTRTQCEVIRLFRETHPDLPPLNQGTISKIEAQYREMGHVRKVPSKRQAVVDDDTKLNLLLALEENPITPARQLARDNKSNLETVYWKKKKSSLSHLMKEHFGENWEYRVDLEWYKKFLFQTEEAAAEESGPGASEGDGIGCDCFHEETADSIPSLFGELVAPLIRAHAEVNGALFGVVKFL